MFSFITDNFQKVYKRLSGNHRISEKNIQEALNDIRNALLDADVHHAHVKILLESLKKQALGKKVLNSISPGQQFIKLVHDELAQFMGKEEVPLKIASSPSFIMLCGLQGCGKTTQAAKLAHYVQKKGISRKVGVVALDLARPAAVLQLETLANEVGVPCLAIKEAKHSLEVLEKIDAWVEEHKLAVVILDTAGRLHVDAPLMEELKTIHERVKPDEVLFVANAALGQQAVHTAEEFLKFIPVTGTILTMLDGTTRAGAAISIRKATNVPLKFEGVGERINDLQPFNPHSMADRIMGMGDTVNLVKKLEEHVSKEDAAQMEEKLKKASFTFTDFLKQFQLIKKMGSFKGLLKMIPGMGGIDLSQMDEGMFSQMEAIILSMTPQERDKPDILEGISNISRRKRIARGSGTSLDEVNKLLNLYMKMRQFLKNTPSMEKMQQMMGPMMQFNGGTTPWH